MKYAYPTMYIEIYVSVCLLVLLLLRLHGPFGLTLASLRIADHSFLSCALI
jgi:hypothetical protein